MAKKKPTKKDLELVVSNLIREIDYIGRNLYEMNTSFGLYLDWKNEKDKFTKFISETVIQAKENIKNQNEDKPRKTK